MISPLMTIEAIGYTGDNSHEIMLWVQQGEKSFVDKRGSLFIDTIKGKEEVEKGNTVLRVGFDMFAVIKHPVSTPSFAPAHNIEIAIHAENQGEFEYALYEIKKTLEGKKLTQEIFFVAESKWSVELNPGK